MKILGRGTRLQEEEDGQNDENHFTRNTHVKFFLYTFDVFSTVISPKDVLIETESRKVEFPYV